MNIFDDRCKNLEFDLHLRNGIRYNFGLKADEVITNGFKHEVEMNKIFGKCFQKFEKEKVELFKSNIGNLGESLVEV